MFNRVHEVVDEALASADGRLVGIIDSIPPCVHLPALKRCYPEIKWIYHSHDVLFQAFLPFAAARSLVARMAWRWEIHRIHRFERMAADLADVYWTITEEDAIESRRAFGRQVDGVLGVDIRPSRFDSVKPGNLHTILYLGSADYRKAHGIRTFLETSWPRLRKAYPQARLLLGGLGTEAFNRPDEGVLGLGFVEDAIAFLGQGFIFFNPQQAGTGIKIKSLNAMAAGKLLISSANGVLGIGGRDKVHYRVAETAEALSGVILDAWENPETACRVAANGKKLVQENFNAEVLATAFDTLINEAMKKLV